MGKLKARNKPCSRGDDCCMYSPCQWSNLNKKKADNDNKDKKKKDKKEKKGEKKKDKKDKKKKKKDKKE